MQTCLKKLVMVSVAGLKPVRLHDSSPLVVLSRERLPMMLEFLRSDHEPFLSADMQQNQHLRSTFVFTSAFCKLFQQQAEDDARLLSHMTENIHVSNLPSNEKGVHQS